MKKEHIISAIIGYHRSGATVKQIMAITNVPVQEIKEILLTVK